MKIIKLNIHPRMGWMGDMFFAGRNIVSGRVPVFEISKVFYDKEKCREYIKEHNILFDRQQEDLLAAE